MNEKPLELRQGNSRYGMDCKFATEEEIKLTKRWLIMQLLIYHKDGNLEEVQFKYIESLINEAFPENNNLKRKGVKTK